MSSGKFIAAGVEVRLMRPSDIGGAYSVISSSLDEYFVPDIPAYFLSQWPRGSFVAADYSGRIVGYIAGARLPSSRASVSLLCVSDGYRGSGIGSSLLSHLMTSARLEGIRTIQLEVRRENVRAIRFYTRHGFTVSEDLPSFYNDGGDAVRMTSSSYGINN